MGTPADDGEESIRWWVLYIVYACVLGVFVIQVHAQWIINPQYAYGWSVPFLSLFLLHRRRLAKPAALAFSGDPSGMRVAWVFFWALLVAYLPLQLVLEANPDWRLLSFAIALQAILIAASCAGALLGWRVLRLCVVPFAFLLLAIPWPQTLETHLIQSLTQTNVAVVIDALSLFGVPSVQHGNVIEVATGVVGVSEACSGIRSFQVTMMMGVFFGEFFRLTIVSRVLLTALGLGLALLGNLVRTFTLAFVGGTQGLEALHAWHDPTGVLILLFVFTGTWWIAFHLSRSARRSFVAGPPPQQWSPFVWRRALRPSTAILAAYVLSLLLAGAWYRSHERGLAPINQWGVSWPQANPTTKEFVISDAAKEMLIFDEGRSASWTAADGKRWQAIFMRWRPGHAGTQAVYVHNPNVCLTASGRRLLSSGSVTETKIQGVVLNFESFVFDEFGQPLFVFRCVDNDLNRSRTGRSVSATWGRSERLRAVWEGKRQRNDQRVLEIAVTGPADIVAAEAALRDELATLVHFQG